MMLLSGMAARPAFQLRFFVWRLKIVYRTRAMPASTSQRRTKPKVRRNSDVIDVITMYLEPNRDDRDYLYGRLLALADNFEESVLRKQGVKDRPTNAIKLMSNFTAKPYTTWGTLWKQLTPYLKSANGGSWFRNEVDDVMALFKEGDFEDNKALSPMFLLGYSCQRRAS
jgi:CRISPR-associated protein Csd1